jgi:putative transposase
MSLFQNICTGFGSSQKNKENKIQLVLVRPGKPMENAYIERFNGSFRRELLNAYVFRNIREVRILAEEWMIDYNQNCPHKALNYLSPIEYENLAKIV